MSLNSIQSRRSRVRRAGAEDGDPVEADTSAPQGTDGGGGRNVDDGGLQASVDQLRGQLAQKDTALRRLRVEMVEKERELLRLRRHVDSIEEDSPEDDTVAEVHELREENVGLREQVEEMKRYLSDYGLVWVGGPPGPRSGESEAKEEPDFAEIEFDRLVQSIKELSREAAQYARQVVDVAQSGQQAQLRHQESVRLTLFADGIRVRDGAFRPFTADATQAFVQDVLDGYYPKEFQKDYPDGVMFHLLDRRHVRHSGGHGEGEGKGDSGTPVFHGEGRRLDGADAGEADGESPSMRSNDGAESKTSQEATGLARLGGDSLSVGDAWPPEFVGERQGVITTEGVVGGGDRSEGDIRIQVRSVDGTQTLQLDAVHECTVGQLCEAINGHRVHQRGFELRSMYPRRAFTDMGARLGDLDLGPAVRLILRPQDGDGEGS